MDGIFGIPSIASISPQYGIQPEGNSEKSSSAYIPPVSAGDSSSGDGSHIGNGTNSGGSQHAGNPLPDRPGMTLSTDVGSIAEGTSNNMREGAPSGHDVAVDGRLENMLDSAYKLSLHSDFSDSIPQRVGVKSTGETVSSRPQAPTGESGNPVQMQTRGISVNLDEAFHINLSPVDELENMCFLEKTRSGYNKLGKSTSKTPAESTIFSSGKDAPPQFETAVNKIATQQEQNVSSPFKSVNIPRNDSQTAANQSPLTEPLINHNKPSFGFPEVSLPFQTVRQENEQAPAIPAPTSPKIPFDLHTAENSQQQTLQFVTAPENQIISSDRTPRQMINIPAPSESLNLSETAAMLGYLSPVEQKRQNTETSALLNGLASEIPLVLSHNMIYLRRIMELPFSLYLFGNVDLKALKNHTSDNDDLIPDEGVKKHASAELGYLRLSEAVKIAAVVHNLYHGGSGMFSEEIPWYRVYVRYAIDNGIIKEGDFNDYTKNTTRAEMAYVFSRSIPEAELYTINYVPSLPDVSLDTKYSENIFKLYRAGILLGSDQAGTFHPQRPVSKAEAAIIMGRIVILSNRKKRNYQLHL